MSPFLSFRNAVIGFAFVAIAAFALALSCQRPAPTPAALSHAHAVTTQAVAVADSARSKVKVAHAVSAIRLKTLKPLRDAVSITPNGVTVNGSDDSATVIHGLAVVVLKQDTVISALLDESAMKDTALAADSAALVASQEETKVAVSLIPSKWQRVKTAAKWSVIGTTVYEIGKAIVRAVRPK